MPRRSSARFIEPQLQQESISELTTCQENFQILRKQWKWAAFSQFFYTFAHLCAMNDVSINVFHHVLIF